MNNLLDNKGAKVDINCRIFHRANKHIASEAQKLREEQSSVSHSLQPWRAKCCVATTTDAQLWRNWV